MNTIKFELVLRLIPKKYFIMFSKEFYELVKLKHERSSINSSTDYDTLSTHQWSKVSFYTRLSLDLIRKYKDNVEWISVSHIQDMNDSFVDEMSNYIDFTWLSRNWNYAPSYYILYKYINKPWDWDFLSANNNISDTTILTLKDKFNWRIISYTRTISYELAYEAKEYIDWPIFYENNLQVNNEQLFFYQDLSIRMRLRFVEGLLDYFRTRNGKEVSSQLDYTKVIDYQDNCPICRDSSTEVSGFVKIKCNHIFHKSCILDWVQLSMTCPMCRVKL